MESLAGDLPALRDLFRLVGDKAAEAAIDRQIMGQPEQVEVTDMRPRHG